MYGVVRPGNRARLAGLLAISVCVFGCIHVLTQMRANPNPTLASRVDGVVTIGSGLFHTCVALADGQIRCRRGGSGSFDARGGVRVNRLFVGTTQFQESPVLKNDYVCGLGEGGVVTCWSDDGRMHTLTARGALDIAGSGALACAVMEDRSGNCWMFGHRLESVKVLGPFPRIDFQDGAKPVRLVRGFFHHCALLDDGTVACWGDNQLGQLGQGTTGGPSKTPVRVVLEAPGSRLDGIISIEARDRYTCAVRKDGTVMCWGGLPGVKKGWPSVGRTP